MTESKRTRLAPWAAVVLGALIVSLPIAGSFGRENWKLDLFNHFQIQYAGALFLLALLLGLRRCWGPAIMVIVFLSFPLAKLRPCYFPRPNATPSAELKVVTFNVLGQNRRFSDCEAWIRDQRPDFIYLAEATPEWIEQLAGLSDIYPYRIAKPISGNFGFMFLSLHPLRDTEVPVMGRLAIPLLDTVVDLPGGPLRVFGAHPVPPTTRFWAGERDDYINFMAQRVEASAGPIAVIGDLNATRWSHVIKPLFDAGLIDASLGHGYQATWQRTNPILAIPIDHILTRGIGPAVSYQIGPDLGSDHRPVVAEFAPGQ